MFASMGIMVGTYVVSRLIIYSILKPTFSDILSLLN